MDFQTQIKPKRKPSRKAKNSDKQVSSFIHSVLSNGPIEANSHCRIDAGPSDDKRIHGSTSTKKTKKAKLDGSLLAWVKWPEDSGSGESIDTYSEGSEASDQLSLSGGEQQYSTRLSDEIEDYMEESATASCSAPVAGGGGGGDGGGDGSGYHLSLLQGNMLGKKRRRRRGERGERGGRGRRDRRMGFLTTSTPCRDNRLDHSTEHEEVIVTSSSDSEAASNSQIMGRAAHKERQRRRQKQTDSRTSPATSLSSDNEEEEEEEDFIATPPCTPSPRSPRCTPPSPSLVVGRTSTSTATKAKASDWLRQVSLTSEVSGGPGGGGGGGTDLEESSCNRKLLSTTYDHTACTSSGHVDNSASSNSKRRRFRYKYVAAGLAERLRRIVQCENSEVTFWEHKARRKETVDSTDHLLVHTLSLVKCCGLFLAKCRVLEGTLTGHVRRTATPPPAQPADTPTKHATPTKSDTPTCAKPPKLATPSPQHTNTPLKPDTSCGTQEESDVSTCDGESVVVLLTTRTAKFLNLRLGTQFSIHSPWQCLTIPHQREKVLLCCHFCRPVGFVPVSPGPRLQHAQHGDSSASIAADATTTGPDASLYHLLRSPRKALFPTQLFTTTTCNTSLSETTCSSNSGAVDHSSLMAMASAVAACSSTHLQLPATSAAVHVRSPQLHLVQNCCSDVSASVRASFLAALESARGGRVSFVATVRRVYRKMMFPRQKPKYHGESSMSECFLKGAKERLSLNCSKYQWAVLLCDADGVFTELRLSEEGEHAKWSRIVQDGEGKKFCFSELLIEQRTTPSKYPELFSLLESAQIQQPVLDSTCEGEVEKVPPGSHHSPPFCYLLSTTSNSRFCEVHLHAPAAPDPEEQHMHSASAGHGVTTRPLGSLHQACGRFLSADCKDRSTTVSFLARVVHIQLEVACETEDDGRLPTTLFSSRLNCGYFLFAVAPVTVATDSSHRQSRSGSGLGGGLRELDTLPSRAVVDQHQHRFLRVYLKPSFCLAGLQAALGVPGTKVFLRDVEVGHDAVDQGPEYSMSMCSMVFPVDTRQSVGPPYPGMQSLSVEEAWVLSCVCCPGLPELDPLTTSVGSLVAVQGIIVGVDEENAFSWPACDVCGNGKLSSFQNTQSNETLYCEECERRVTEPSIHMQLAVFVHCNRSSSQHTVAIQLLQKTIHQLLPFSLLNIEDGFDVNTLLDKEVLLQACYLLETKDSKDGTLLYLEEVDITFREENNEAG